MKRLLTFCVVVFVLTFSCLVQAGTIASDPDYKASTNLSIGALVTIREGTQWELTGYEISDEFQLNLLYQAGILDSDIDNINHYWQVMTGATYNFPDHEEYVLNVSAAGGLTIYEYDGMQETTGGPDIKWTLTGWHQTILAGDIIDNGNGTITLQVLPIGTYRPFVGDPPVNNVEVFDGDVDCEVLGYTFTGSIGDIGDGSVLSVILVPAPTEVWVDDDFDNSTPGWGTTHFNMIQDGIDALTDGGTAYVSEGEYSENLLIDGIDVSLIAVGDVTVDGSTNGYYDKTIAIYNATCVIDGFNVKHNGSAIYARGMASNGESDVYVIIRDCSVTDYIKNGITVNGELATGLIKDNMIISSADSTYAQNGIQFGYGATGHALGNIVITDWYTGEGWTACGILLFESDKVSVTKNYIEYAQTGVGVEAWGWFCPSADKNVVVNNTIKNSDWGISVTAISWDGYSTMDCSANNNKITNNVITAEDEEIGQIGVYVGAYDNSDDYDSEADNNKVINNKISGFDEDVVDEGTTTKIHANKIPYE